MSVKIEILDYVYNNANVLDWEKSILGELDVTDHSDFPLAMTFHPGNRNDGRIMPHTFAEAQRKLGVRKMGFRK